MKTIKKYWLLFLLSIIGLAVFVIRAVCKNTRGDKDSEMMRLTVAHLEAEAKAIGKRIHDHKKKIKSLKDKYSKPIRVLAFLLLLPSLTFAYFPVYVAGEMRDYGSCTNAIEYFQQTTAEYEYLVMDYETRVRTLSNLMAVQTEIYKRNQPSALEGFLYRWLPPVCLGLGIFMGFKAAK